MNTSKLADIAEINNPVAEPEKKNYSESKLLEEIDGQRLDTRAQGEAISSDTALEAVAEFNRAEDT